MNKTKIEWVKNPDGTQGYTWNPITGCLNGCEYCYARKLACGRLKARYLANKNTAPQVGPVCFRLFPEHPFYPRFWHRRIAGGSSKGIFACDMGELFGDWIPPWWQDVIFAQIRLYKQHRFYLLTKQPQNLIKFSPFPDNCWVGVTATDYESFYFGAVKYLPKVQAKVKFISFEPLLGWSKHIPGWITACLIDAGINWLIIGAQTKPYKPPRIEWVEEIVRAADKAGIPVFLKTNLEPNIHEPFGVMRMPLYKRQGEHHTLDLRQELP